MASSTMSSENVTATIEEASDAKSMREWALLPFKILGNEPGWVPPLRTDAVNEVDSRKNPFHRHAVTKHFLAKEGETVVGRISATIHSAYNEKHGRNDVFFGFPVTRDGAGALAPLMDAVMDFGRSRGMTNIAGPFNYWSGAECGVLLDRFQEATAAFQPWNPPGLQGSLQNLGFGVRNEMQAYKLPTRQLDGIRADLYGMAANVRTATGISTRPLNMRDYEGDLELIRRLHESSFATDPEVVAYPKDVFDHMIGPLKGLIDPNLVRIAERNGKPVGFALTLPDVNQALKRWNGRLGLWDLVRLPFDKRLIDEVVVLLLGTVPSCPMGVGHVLFADTLTAIEEGGYRTIHTTWVHQKKSLMRALLESSLKLHPTRRWAIMSRSLG